MLWQKSYGEFGITPRHVGTIFAGLLGLIVALIPATLVLCIPVAILLTVTGGSPVLVGLLAIIAWPAVKNRQKRQSA